MLQKKQERNLRELKYRAAVLGAASLSIFLDDYGFVYDLIKNG